MSKKWTSLLALMLILLFAAAADGVMDNLGPLGFLTVGSAALGAAWRLTAPETSDTVEADL